MSERDGKRRSQHAPTAAKTKAGANGSILGLVGAAVVVLGGLMAVMAWETGAFHPKASGTASASADSRIGGPFQMVDQGGKPVDQGLLKGKWSLVFFGYTYCPDVCPATLQALGQAAKRMGANARDLQVVFVTVDPERDHPEQMKAYIAAQDLPTPTIGLTGTPAQVATITKAYRASYEKVGTGPTYSMDHTAAVYLMDPQGRFATVVSHGMTPDKIAGEILSAEGRS